MKKVVLIFLPFAFLAFFVSCASSSPEIYKNDAIGLQLEFPSDWSIEEPERIMALILNPERGRDSSHVSITVVSNLNVDRDLSEALEGEMNRLKNNWSMDEITVVEPINRSTLNDFEVAKVTIEAPLQSQNEEAENRFITFQPMDILMLDAGDQFIEIYFRRSTTNSNLNDEGKTIINSIAAYP